MKKIILIPFFLSVVVPMFAQRDISSIGKLILIEDKECISDSIFGLETNMGDTYLIRYETNRICKETFTLNDTTYNAGEWVVVTGTLIEGQQFGKNVIDLVSIRRTGLQHFLPRENAYLSILDQKFHFSGDSIINGMRYTRVYRQHCKSPDECLKWNYYAAVREDTINGKIHCIFNDIYVKKEEDRDKEVLLADFNVKKGDKVKIVFVMMWNIYSESYQSKDYSVVVESVDSVLINGQYRKRINNVPRDYNRKDAWIEGIGCVHSGLFFPYSGIIIDIGDPPLFLCMHVNGELLYQSELGAHCDCFMKDSGVNIDEVSKLNFKVYPIPSENVLYIETDSDETDFLYSICDVSGRILLSGVSKDKKIRTFSLSPGLYLVSLYKNNVPYYTGKFIK